MWHCFLLFHYYLVWYENTRLCRHCYNIHHTHHAYPQDSGTDVQIAVWHFIMLLCLNGKQYTSGSLFFLWGMETFCRHKFQLRVNSVYMYIHVVYKGIYIHMYVYRTYTCTCIGFMCWEPKLIKTHNMYSSLINISVHFTSLRTTIYQKDKQLSHPNDTCIRVYPSYSQRAATYHADNQLRNHKLHSIDCCLVYI